MPNHELLERKMEGPLYTEIACRQWGGRFATGSTILTLRKLDWITSRQPRCRFCLVGFLRFSSETRLSRGLISRLTSDNFTDCHTETERGDHDLSRLHYTDTDPTSRERARGSNPQSPDQKLRGLSNDLLQAQETKVNSSCHTLQLARVLSGLETDHSPLFSQADLMR